MLELYSPDVVGIQEKSDIWYCLLRNNLPKKYKMLFSFSSGARADTFALLSYDCLAEMSDYYPIFADIAL